MGKSTIKYYEWRAIDGKIIEMMGGFFLTMRVTMVGVSLNHPTPQKSQRPSSFQSLKVEEHCTSN
jgi:hypothetical protein